MSTSYYVGEAVFSAGGVLVNEVKKEVFLVFKVASDEWLLPKGHMESGESIKQTAEREIYEETGYKNTVGRLLSVQIRPDMADQSKSKVIFWFYSVLGTEERAENTQVNDENFIGKWFSQNEAINSLKWDEDKKLIEKVFELGEN